jgi:phage terminase large subunit-like protein
MWQLVEHGRRGDDPSFAYVEYAAPDGCAVDDEDAWATANPALDDYLARDALRSTLRTTREASFRRYRLGQWVGQAGAWLPFGVWERLEVDRDVPDGAPVVLGFDGSASGDSTALVGCTVDEIPHVFVVDVWDNPGDPRWRVPRGDVDRAVDAAFARWEVAELAADPWGWRSELEGWQQRHERVVEWPTNVIGRMAPATDRLYAAIADGQVTHDGDERLARHLAHCVAKPTTHGDVVVKDKKNSTRKIDAAVAAIVAHDRAVWHHTRPRRRRRMLVR